MTLRNFTIYAIVLLMAVTSVACKKSPSAVLRAMQEAAREGDVERFASFFTEDSRPFARALMAVYRTHAVAGGDPSKPLLVLADSTVVEERVENERALLTVTTGKDLESRSVLVFRKDSKDGQWKLDIEETEHRNIER